MSLDKTKLCNELKIVDRINESLDSVTLVLDIPDTLKTKFKYKAGQFVTFFLDIEGQELHRSYSLCTSPDHDKTFAVTIKKVLGGKGSTLLTEKVKVGDTLWTTPPAGRFVLPEKIQDQKLVFYAGGSGITPIFSIIKTALKTTNLPTLLFYQNKEQASIIFQKHIEELKKTYGDRFIYSHILSKPTAGWSGLHGRIDQAAIKEFLVKNQVGIRALHFLCGPDGFMRTVVESLEGMSVPKEKIIQESFTTVAPIEESSTLTAINADGEKPDLKNKVVIGEFAAHSAPETIEAVIDGETKSVPYKKNASILETLLEAGLNPPYSCMDGACMACMGKIEKGLVYQRDPGILSDDNIEAGECLTCQAKPASKHVKINYNAF